MRDNTTKGMQGWSIDEERNKPVTELKVGESLDAALGACTSRVHFTALSNMPDIGAKALETVDMVDVQYVRRAEMYFEEMHLGTSWDNID